MAQRYSECKACKCDYSITGSWSYVEANDDGRCWPCKEGSEKPKEDDVAHSSLLKSNVIKFRPRQEIK